MEYVEAEAARGMPGVKLVLTKGVVGPWGQAVKKMLEYKGIPYIPIAQYFGETNDALVAWTGHRNAPTIVPDAGAPVERWIDQIVFVDRLAADPPLLPRDSDARAAVFGIINEIAGEDGFGWSRRLQMFEATRKAGGEDDRVARMRDSYTAQDAAEAAILDRIVDIMNMLAQRLHVQRGMGSDYLVGNVLSAADIYWAAFSTMIAPLPERVYPGPEAMLQGVPAPYPAIMAANDPILMAHRDLMFDRHLGPIDF